MTTEPDPTRCVRAEAHWAYTTIAELRLCGCGYYDEIIGELLTMLRACPLYDGNWQPADEWGIFGAELLVHVADGAGLVEHGSSVGGSWITDKGKLLLAVMDGKPDDWLDDEGSFSCSDCPPVDLTVAQHDQ
jgi:hypothetical protein